VRGDDKATKQLALLCRWTSCVWMSRPRQIIEKSGRSSVMFRRTKKTGSLLWIITTLVVH